MIEMVRTSPLLWLIVIAMLASGVAIAQDGGSGGNANTNGSMIGVNEGNPETAPVASGAVPNVGPPSQSAPAGAAPSRQEPPSAARAGKRPAIVARTGAHPAVVAVPTMAPPATVPRAVAPPSYNPQTGTLSGNVNTNGSLMGLDDGR